MCEVDSGAVTGIAKLSAGAAAAAGIRRPDRKVPSRDYPGGCPSQDDLLAHLV